MSELRHLVPDTLPRPNGYSHVVSAPAERIVFVSGQVPLNADGDLVGPGDVAVQARQVFENLTRALEAEGTTWANVVKLNYFVRDVAEMPTVRRIRDEYVEAERPPASTLVEVNRLFRDDVLIEIDAIAVR
jgi:reactive intermediate/imine deaminase